MDLSLGVNCNFNDTSDSKSLVNYDEAEHFSQVVSTNLYLLSALVVVLKGWNK